MNAEVLDKPTLSEVAVYNPIEAGIALLVERHGHVLTTAPDVSTAKALALTKTSRQELVKFRTRIESARKQEKAESLAYGRLVDSEAARITAIAAPYEKAYDDAITAEENRLEAIRLAEIEAERVRVSGIHARIAYIKSFVGLALECRTSAKVEELIDKLLVAFAEGGFAEFEEEAIYAKVATLDRLRSISDAKMQEEQDRVRIKAEQEAEAQRLTAQRVENERLAAERKAEQDKRDAEAQRQRDADAAEMKRQRDALDAENARINVARMEVERQKLELTKQAEPVIEQSKPILQPAAPVVDKTVARPSRMAIIELVAKTYGVEMGVALDWLARSNFSTVQL